MSSIRYEKRGQFWQYVFDVAKIESKRKRMTKSGFATKAKATEAGVRAMAEFNESGKYFAESTISFNDFLNNWIKGYCSVNLKISTINHYQKK